MVCVPPKKELCGTSKFDVSSTGMPYYDAMLGKGEIVGKFRGDPKGYFRSKGIDFDIKCITPDDYFIEVAKFHGKTPELEKRFGILRDWVEDYKNLVLKCSPMPLPVLDYKDKIQEGRHRTMVALELGIKKIPVLIVKKSK